MVLHRRTHGGPGCRRPGLWGWGLGWHDVVLGAVFYVIAGLGVTAGFHRYFTHGAYKAKRWLEITMAVAACLSLEMSPTGWVAEHRRHHQFSDEETILIRPGGSVRPSGP